MRFSIVPLVITFAVSAFAVPHPSNHVVHEKRQSTSSWAKRDRTHPDAVLPMRIGLTQTNLDKGHDALMRV